MKFKNFMTTQQAMRQHNIIKPTTKKVIGKDLLVDDFLIHCKMIKVCLFVGKPVLTFDEAQTTTTQNVASRLVIPVEVTGLPVPMVSWTFSNGPLDGALVKGDDTFTNLTIESLDSKQQGVYTLKAINAAGEATAQFTVNLQGMKNLFSVFVQWHTIIVDIHSMVRFNSNHFIMYKH